MSYSYLSAFTGSSFVARRAGQKQAIMATAVSSRLIEINVTGSAGPARVGHGQAG